ncbi:MAG: hypothetical protein ACO3I0_07225 [Limisphaerales bacterium]
MRVAGRSAVVMAWVAAGLLLVTGCAGLSTGGRLTELHLFGVPVALNLGSKTGPDGIGLRLYASTADVAKGIPIREGVLEILMFDGSVGEAYARSEKPLKSWSFTSSQLGALAGTSSLGVGYQFPLRWGTEAPRQPVVTVIARHVAPNKTVTWSTATTISVVTR